MTKLRKYCLKMGMGLLFGILVMPSFAQFPAEDDSSLQLLWEWDQALRVRDRTPFSIPFFYSSEDEQEEFSFSWKTDQQFQDSIYLHFLGIAWVADLYLNNKFLASLQRPLETRIISVAPEWLNEGENLLVLKIHQKGYYPNYPEAFTGILNSIQVLEEKPLPLTTGNILTDSGPDSVWVWAPYFRDFGYRYTDSIALSDLFHILNSSVRSVYFPFPPSPQLLKLVDKWELEKVDSLPASVYLAMLNPFPYEELSFSLPQNFWLDEVGKRNTNYGQFIKWENQNIQSDPLTPGLGIVTILLFSILALIIVKFANPSFYFAIRRMITQPNKYIDSLQEATSGNSGFS